MRFESPEWLYLFIVWAVILTYFGWWKQLSKLRLLLLGLVTLVLASPHWRKQGDEMELLVLVDRSDSAKELLSARLKEWESFLQKGKKANDELRFFDFASEVSPQGVIWGGSSATYSGPTQSSRIASAVRFALNQKNPNLRTKILLFTDGYSTEPVSDLGATLRENDVSLYTRYTTPAEDLDFRITDVNLPTRVQPKQVYIGTAQVTGPKNSKAKIHLLRNRQVVSSGEVTLENGKAQWRFSDVATFGGAVEYTVKVEAPGDPLLENNVATSWVEVEGGKAILLLSAFESDPVEETLKEYGFEVRKRDDGSQLKTGDLSQVRAVIFNNYPAHQVSQDFLKALPYYVQNQGGGLMMLGGEKSFGAGGYFRSPVDELLPVSMELKEDVKRLATAIVYVLDRSGSMSASVGGKTKMDLANDGTARSIELLGEHDFASILAVDSKAHVASPMVAVSSNKGRLLEMSRRVKSMGGGIFVYEGLEAAYKELKKVKVGQRHVILFSDAADSEEPGEYKQLLKRFETEKITVSVIGLGTEKDADANLLKEIATLGGGRIFFCNNAEDLPAVFAQETVSVARSAFLKEITPQVILPGISTILQRNLALPESVEGYNLSYLREGATMGSQSKDSYQAPLMAFWQKGVGRSIAISYPLAGKYSDQIRLSKEYGSWVSSLAQWVQGDGLPPGLTLRTELEGEELWVDLYFDETWTEALLKHLPQVTLVSEKNDAIREVPWERIAANSFRLKYRLEAGDPVRGAIQIGDKAVAFGPVTYHLNPEWNFHPQAREDLLRVAQSSGGGELLNFDEIWQRDRQQNWVNLVPWVLPLWLLLMLLEAYFSKIGKARSTSFWLSPLKWTK